MKYLLLILLGLLALQVTHSQLPDDTTADIDISALQEVEEEQEEEQASGVGEVIIEEENESNPEEQQEAVEESAVSEEVVEVESEIIENLSPEEAVEAVGILEDSIEEEIPDASGSVNVSVSKWLNNSWNKQVLGFVFQWQLTLLEGLEIFPTYYAMSLDKVNFISFNKQEGVWRINLRVRDVEISNNFYTGHSVVKISETPNKQFEILRTRWGYNSEVAEDLQNPAIANFVNSNWSSIDPAVAQEDPAFNDIFDYALNLTLEFAPSRYLSSFGKDWTLKSLTDVYIQEKSDGNVYHMTVLLSGANDYTARVEMVVLKKPDGTKNFINYGIDLVAPATA